MPHVDQRSNDASLAERITGLERRLARIEDALGLDPSAAKIPAEPPPASLTPVHFRSEQELEYEVGQNWFAPAGITVLALGAGFLLFLPFADLPRAFPPLAGYVLAAVVFALAHAGKKSFAFLSQYLSGAAMALLVCATLRCFFPEARRVLPVDSTGGGALLLATVAGNLAVALRRRSPGLTGVALLSGCVAILASGSGGFAPSALCALAIAVIAASYRRNWRSLGIAAIPIVFLAYLAWALGSPVFSRPLHFATAPAFAPGLVLVTAAFFATAALFRPANEPEGIGESIAALLTCALGYGVYFLHTVAAFSDAVVLSHAIAAGFFLAVAIAFWTRRQSHVATFFYAMTGYAALSVAILKAASAPGVFVWLSVQSVVVVTTAIWFRSRLIVVANFLIYVGIVFVYLFVVERETGISLGFGLVALASARALNWQQQRLTLKTELMRNAYLLSAFLVFPYALYHLVPTRFVGFAWVGLALAYYILNFAVQNQKYRWMGHATLLLTTCYLVVVGTRQFEPAYRILSFLVVGTVLLAVSFTFTRARKRESVPTSPTATPSSPDS